jgi:carbamoylphosphate synthase large subunit
MILQILLGLSALNLLSNFLNHFRIKRLMLKQQQSESKSSSPPAQTLEKVEEDLNRRLRMLQTSNFAPKMGRRNVQFIPTPGKDD